MTFSGACQNSADVPGIGGRRLETCRRRGDRLGVVCYMRLGAPYEVARDDGPRKVWCLRFVA